MAKSKFEKWVTDFGKENLAEKIGCHPAAIRYWLKGYSTPQLVFVRRMLEISNGSLSLDDICRGTRVNRSKRD